MFEARGSFEKEMVKLVPGSTGEELWNSKNQFAFSVFVQRIRGAKCGVILRTHQETQNARGAFQDFEKHYESPDNLQVVAQTSLTTIENLQLTRNFRNGVVGFITKLENTYMDLEYCTNVRKSDHEKKAKLLQAIIDTRYLSTRDAFAIMDISFEECLRKLMQLATMFGGKAGKINQQITGGDDSSDSTNKGSNVKSTKVAAVNLANNLKQGGMLPKAEWDKLTWPQKQAIFKARKAHKKKMANKKDGKIKKTEKSRVSAVLTEITPEPEDEDDGEGEEDEEGEEDPEEEEEVDLSTIVNSIVNRRVSIFRTSR